MRPPSHPWFAERVAAGDRTNEQGAAPVEMRLEIVVLPVHEVDRAKAFYRSVGFREDVDYASGVALRIVRFTPPGSDASIVFGVGISSARPGSVQGLVLAVHNIKAARERLLARGVDVSEIFHDSGRVFYHLSPAHLEVGPDPAGRDHASFARFSDPDGNGWLIQEARLVRSRPGIGARGRDPVEELVAPWCPSDAGANLDDARCVWPVRPGCAEQKLAAARRAVTLEIERLADLKIRGGCRRG
jgi:catechol 2,3-dioxygenase-like lactoylglutathione lyase family enzyme